MFVTKFNRSFGYPRKDTCSTCDSFRVELGKPHAPEKITALKTQQELHWRKGQTFYDRKTQAGHDSKAIPNLAAVCFDFWKNLPCPNITTSDVYYKRQLSLYTFNVHNLGDGSVSLYTYDESVGKKGANEVSSMLLHFFNTLPEEVTHLKLFCDSCGGQNKNYTVLKFLHYMVTFRKRFDFIKIMFPIRGHSYMECDRDMVMVNQNTPCETPQHWRNHFAEARTKPQPFQVIDVRRESLLSIDSHLQSMYYSTNPVKMQKQREIIISREHPRLVRFRDNWNGPFQTAAIAKPATGVRTPILPPLAPSHAGPIAINPKKLKDILFLKRFCPSQDGRDFFSSFSAPNSTEEIDDDDNVSIIDSEEEDES